MISYEDWNNNKKEKNIFFLDKILPILKNSEGYFFTIEDIQRYYFDKKGFPLYSYYKIRQAIINSKYPQSELITIDNGIFKICSYNHEEWYLDKEVIIRTKINNKPVYCLTTVKEKNIYRGE